MTLTPEQRAMLRAKLDHAHGEACTCDWHALLTAHDALAADNRALRAKVEEFFAANDALDAYHHTLRVPHPAISRLDAAEKALRQALTATRPPEAPKPSLTELADQWDETLRRLAEHEGEAPKGDPR